MKQSTFSRTAQRNLEEQPVNSAFKASSQLHNALMKEYKKPDNSSMNKVMLSSTGKESVRLARQEKELKQIEQTLQSEVASLPKFVVPVYREQTHILVETQKDSRRERHLKFCDEFERWISRLSKNIEEAYKDIKRDIGDFFKDSDDEITNYYSSLTDKSLLDREIEFVENIRKTVEEHENKRIAKVQNLDQRLEDLEKERLRSLELFCNKYQDGLIDVAFQLEPEIVAKVQIHRDEFKQLVISKRELNKIYLDEVNSRQSETFKKYKEIQLEKDQRWRDLKHQNYIEQFNSEIQKLEYVYPDNRVELYKGFKNTQIDIYRERKQYLEKLNNYDIGMLTKSFVEKWIDEIKRYNELVSQTIDVCCKNLLEESEQTHIKCCTRFELLKQQLYYASALPQEQLDQLLQDQFYTIVNQLNLSTRDLMAKAIEFYERIDQQQMDIMNNYGNYFLKLATKNDEYKTDIQLMNHNYEITKAQAADKNDDTLEELKKQIISDKLSLTQALHHPKLEECLQKCNLTLDQFTAEYNRFHQENKSIAASHPTIIMNKHQTFEKNILNIFEMVDPNKEPILVEKFKKIAETKIKYQIAKEEYLKKIEEEKAIEEAKNKKGGKAPASKPKDQKKFQQELEDRMKVLMKEMPPKEVTKFSSNLKQNYIFLYSSEEIVEKFFTPPDEQEQLNTKLQQEQSELEAIIALQNAPKDPKAKPQPPPPIELPPYIPEEDVPKKEVDFQEEAPQNVLNQFVLEKNAVIQINYLSDLINITRTKVIDYVNQCLTYQNEQGNQSDQQFLVESEKNLEKMCNGIEPQKKEIKETIYAQRAQQITLHKKKYERYAKQLVEKIDGQTEMINFHLEGALLDMKEYIRDQQNLKNSLQTATTLAKLQGIQNSVKENYFKFGEKISDMESKLNILAKVELDQLSKRNSEYMRDCKHQNDGGEYSDDEIKWYQSMMDEHNNTIERHKQQRNQRLEEIKKVLNLKKQEQLDKFEQEYAIAVEDLAAKDGTGKKYGRPKRIAQEKLRTEMTKCEKAQECIINKFKCLKQCYEEFETHQDGSYYVKLNPSFSIKVRQMLMGLLLCIRRYATHIEALKVDNKLQEMPRITFKETKFDTLLENDETNEDKKGMEMELESMGPLYYGGDKKFQENISEIEKIIKEEAIKIYADKQKFLTGTDKIPDYLRNYIENMNRNMVEFRISSIRELRNLCEELSEFTLKISEMVMLSNKCKFIYLIQQMNQNIWDQFKLEQNKQEKLKKQHQKQLRPNLGNPQCKQELEDLKNREQERLTTFLNNINQYLLKLLNENFIQGDSFLKVICQNFEFLCLYYDSLLLFEDFVKLPGDEQIQKKHQNLKVSLRQKQNGQIIDTNSERSLSKNWDGILLELFQIDERSIQYVWQPNLPPQKIDPKDAKKPPDPKKAPAKGEVIQPVQITSTQSIKSYKTYRQKSAKTQFTHSVNEYQMQFQKAINYAKEEMKMQTERELKFQFKWEQSINSL